MKFALAFTLVLLCGCAQRNRQADTLNQGSAIDRIEAMRANTAKDDATPAALKDVTASNNATQQSLTGFGVQISKLAESFKVMDAFAQFKNEMMNTVHAALDVQVKNEMKSEIEVKNKMIAELHAEVNGLKIQNAKLEAQGAVQASNIQALKAENHQTTQNTSAGHDSTVINFTSDMAKLIVAMSQNQVDSTEKQMWAMVAIVTALCGCITVAFKASRDRAHARLAQKEKE